MCTNKTKALAFSHHANVFRLSLIVTPTHNNNNYVYSLTACWPASCSILAFLNRDGISVKLSLHAHKLSGSNLEITENHQPRVLVVLLLQFVFWIDALPRDLQEHRKRSKR